MLSDAKLKVLNKISQKENLPLANYFFDKVKDLEWFYPLKEKGFFLPENSPPEKKQDEKGYYIIPQWNILPYLERVSKQVSVTRNEQYICELLSIITDVTEYHKKKNMPGNYRTWWYFVRILLNLPNKKIPLEILDYIPVWLDSSVDSTLPGSTIVLELLPKFLKGRVTPQDVSKTEKIIDKITDIKWVEDPFGIGEDKEKPKSLIDTHWLSEAFLNDKYSIATKVGDKCSVKPIYIFADKLKEIFRGLNRTRQFELELEKIFIKLRIEHNKYCEYDLFVDVIDRNNNIVHQQLESPIKIKECVCEETFLQKIQSELTQFLPQYNLTEKLTHEIVDRGLYRSFFQDYSYISVQSLHIITKYSSLQVQDTYIYILRDILLAKSRNNQIETIKIINHFLSEDYKYPLFTRLVLFIICDSWNEYQSCFWELIKLSHGDELFNDPNYFSEMYMLLEKNVGNFNQRQKKIINKIIEKGPIKHMESDEQNQVKNYWRQRWYSALNKDPYFESSYLQYKDLTGIEEEVDFKEVRFLWGSGPSPLNKEQIFSMSNKELAEYIRSFKTENRRKGPSSEGLTGMIRLIATEKPDQFIDNLSPFMDTGYYYIYNMLWGFRDAWKEKRVFDWGALLQFIKEYIDRKEFWDDKFKDSDIDFWNADHTWVVIMVGNLLQEGTQSDEWSLPKEYDQVAKDIIFQIIDKIENINDDDEKNGYGNPVEKALNTSNGKIITAMIYLALRIARSEDKVNSKKRIKWNSDYKVNYERLLENDITEAYTLLGQYIRNFYYLDKSWVKQKIKKYEDLENEKLWFSFMCGYLYGVGVFSELYTQMKKHYSRLLEYKFRDENVRRRFVEHISTAYIMDLENLSEQSLFCLLLKKWEPWEIREIIRTFWIERDYILKNIEAAQKIPTLKSRLKDKEKIIAFWEWVYKKYKYSPGLNEEDKKIISDLSKLTILLDEINETNFEWLELSASYVEFNFNSPVFLEYLDGLKDKGEKVYSARSVGKLLLKMLDNFTPEYDLDNVISIVEHLYRVQDPEAKESADNICIIYGRRGFEFLREIYKKYNKGDTSDRL